MPRISEQVEWLSLVDTSGPFLAVSILEQVFPQGLEKVETPRRQRLRSAYDEWRDAVDDGDPQLRDIHSAWVLMVIQDLLEYEDAVLVSRQTMDAKLIYHAPEHGTEAVPDFAVRGDDGKYRMLISFWPPETDLEKPVPSESWPASPLERMTLLCRANDVRSGLVTDGERWMIVNAPVGATSGYTAWLARLWWQEPITLKAFQSLLGVRRCFGPKEETLDALLERSTEFQEEVTDTLGEQVRRAVEILVQSLGRADQDRNGELLKDVMPTELYEAGLTVMMRMVFTLCAEERGLLLLGDPTYDQHYALSTLRAQLREDADRLGVEVLERRHDAWSRMLAVFRVIFGGVEHESLRMPAMGGSLFDPDRFPFLEGRAKRTSWRKMPARPLPIDNRTVLLLLDSLQVLEQRGGAQLLSYRALDVEQIGHVYEGLLEYTVKRLDQVTVGLVGSQKVRHPSLALAELETLKSKGREKDVAVLAELTGRSAAAIGRALERGGDEAALVRLLYACGGDEKLARRLLPFADLIRADSWGTMLVYKPGSFAVVAGTSRRSTGTHYTPKSLTEPIVQHTLEPLVYSGPAEGLQKAEWKLKPPSKLLDLKICDMAMGSGAFLVQVCRYLSEQVAEAWAREETSGKVIAIDGRVLDDPGTAELMPKALDDRLLIARRLIASRCLYGVDINPLAVELGKLSLWLVTMMKNRPFGFLDHALKCGDSLLGVSALLQIENFSLRPGERQVTFATAKLSDYIEEAGKKRGELEDLPSNDHAQIETKSRLHAEAEAATAKVKALADCLIALELRGFDGDTYSDARETEAERVQRLLKQDADDSTQNLREHANAQLRGRRPFHWTIEFPEVFARGGFDAFVGNPPFYAGAWLKTLVGEDYRKFIVEHIADSRVGIRGTADLCVYFLLRARQLKNPSGYTGLILNNAVCDGDSKAVGIDFLLVDGSTIMVAAGRKWPGAASVIYVSLWLYDKTANGSYLIEGLEYSLLKANQEGGQLLGEPYPLEANARIVCKGHELQGDGFKLTAAEANHLRAIAPTNSEVIFPLITGEVLNSSPTFEPQEFVINFGQRTLKEAQSYTRPFAVIFERVKPERDLYTGNTGRDKYLREKWWLFRGYRKEVEEYSRKQSRLLVCTVHTKYVVFAFMDSHVVATPSMFCFFLSRFAEFAVLQSSVHDVWASNYASALGETLRYVAGRCFNTFPMPAANPVVKLDSVGKQFYELRSAIMTSSKQGLTDVYNRFHDRGEASADITRLRALHVDLDQAVAAAYGWRDLDLGHGFHVTKQGERFTISETARRTVLDRLLVLNHQRYEEEVRAGLHEKGKSASAAKRNRKGTAKESSLFEKVDL